MKADMPGLFHTFEKFYSMANITYTGLVRCTVKYISTQSDIRRDAPALRRIYDELVASSYGTN